MILVSKSAKEQECQFWYEGISIFYIKEWYINHVIVNTLLKVDWGYEACLVSGTKGSFTESVLYAHIFKTHLCNHCMGISFQLYSSSSGITNIKAISLIEDQTNANELQMSPKLIQFEGVYDYFILC